MFRVSGERGKINTIPRRFSRFLIIDIWFLKIVYQNILNALMVWKTLIWKRFRDIWQQRPSRTVVGELGVLQL